MNIVSLSGGKDSTAMLFMMLERNIAVDRVIFVDTTKEFPQMYDHIEKVKKMCPVKIEVVKIDFDYWFGEHVKTKGKNKGGIGYGFPLSKARWCTAIKREAIKRTIANSDYMCRRRYAIGKDPDMVVNFIGIAADESHRASRVNDKRSVYRYPLIEWGVTEKMALEYCYSLGFDWGGLYEKFPRVSCWLCPFQRMSSLKIIHDEYPELWKKLVDMENKMKGKYYKGRYTVKDLSAKFSCMNTEVANNLLNIRDAAIRDGMTLLTEDEILEEI